MWLSIVVRFIVCASVLLSFISEVCAVGLITLDDDEDNDRITVRTDEELKLMLFSVSSIVALNVLQNL